MFNEPRDLFDDMHDAAEEIFREQEKRGITVRVASIDGLKKSRKFKTLTGAQKFAQKYVGQHPEMSIAFGYAVGAYGDVKVTLDAAGLTIDQLFPAPAPEAGPVCNGECFECDYECSTCERRRKARQMSASEASAFQLVRFLGYLMSELDAAGNGTWCVF